MSVVDLNRLKGNFSVSYITAKLRKYCLVRQVSEGTNIGIYLYCESLTSMGKPFLHFLIQVKSEESIGLTI